MNQIEDKPMKVLHFISSGGLFGAERVMINLTSAMNSNGLTCQVCALDNAHNPHLEVIDEVNRRNIESFTLKSKGKFDISTIGQLRQLIRNNNIDLLHTHNYKSNMIGMIAAKMEKIPVVATAHGFTDASHSVSIYERMDRWILSSFFSKVVVVTDKILSRMNKAKRHIINNGIDLDEYIRDENGGADLRKKYNIREDAVLVGTVGRLSVEKNQKMILEAMAPVMKDNADIKLIIVGDGPKMGELKEYCCEHDLNDSVIFTGILDNVLPVYSALDIFILSSKTEGVPLTILEAMASKAAVIATRVGGIPDIIKDGDNGILIDPENTDALKNAVSELIDDKGKRQKLSDSAYNFVNTNYSLARMCSAYKKVYEDVCVPNNKGANNDS